MKKIIFFAVILFTAICCQENPIDEVVTTPSDDLVSVTIKAAMPSEAGDTRVSASTDVHGVWKSAWEDDDVITLVAKSDKTVYQSTSVTVADDGVANFTCEVPAGDYDVYCAEGFDTASCSIDYTVQTAGSTPKCDGMPMQAIESLTVEADTNGSYTSPLLVFKNLAQIVKLDFDFLNILATDDNRYSISYVEIIEPESKLQISVPVEGVEILKAGKVIETEVDIYCYLFPFELRTSKSLLFNIGLNKSGDEAAIYKTSATVTNITGETLAFKAGKVNTIKCSKFDPIKESKESWVDFAAATFAGGVEYEYDGHGNKYEISSAEELAFLAKLVNEGQKMSGRTFTLTKDIDLSAHEWTAIGVFNRVDFDSQPFQGIFDGAGFTIKGLHINRPNDNCQGLFGYCDEKSFIIKNLIVEGNVIGNSKVGGIVGWFSYGQIVNCHNNVTVEGKGEVGGIAGNAGLVSIIVNCYNTASVTGIVDGSYSVGGITGTTSRSSIRNCYNTAAVKGVTNYGGVTGSVTEDGSVTNCYWLESKCAQGIGYTYPVNTKVSNVEGKTEAEMQTEAFVVALNKAAYDYNTSDEPANKACLWVAEAGEFPVFDLSKVPVKVLFSGGVGTKEDPYKISTAEEMREISTNVNNGTTYVEKYFKMVNNIDLGGADNEFSVIGGGYDKLFKGSFDGAGFTVKGLYINKPESDYQALFGHIENATVENLTVEGSVIGKEYVGGVVGQSEGVSYITNCHNRAQVTGAQYVGGIAGWLFSRNANSPYYMAQCSNSGSVKGAINVGGVAGKASNGLVTNCFNTATVTLDNNTGTSSYVGGVVGYNGSSKITNCYNIAKVESVNSASSNSIGGVTAYSYSSIGRITNCYNNAELVGANDADEIGGVVAVSDYSKVYSSYWNKELCAKGISSNLGDSNSVIEVIGMTTEQMTAARFVTTLNNKAYTYNKDNSTYPQACEWVELTDGTPTLNFEGEPVFTLIFFSGGSGTESDPYKVSNVEDLREIARMVNNKEPYEGKYFKMTNDIDLGGEECEFTAIGSSSVALFKGSFDGAGFAVNGLYINEPRSSYQGLFGYVDNATIKNLTVEGSVTGGNPSAGIVGTSKNSTITNCHNAVTVNSSSSGGVVGSSNSSNITNCYNTADIESNNNSSNIANVGGVVGFMSNSSVINCYNTGVISGTGNRNVGGVVGNVASGKVINCYWNTTSLEKGVGSGSSQTNIEGMTADEMKLESFVTKLNENSNLYNQENPDATPACEWSADSENINEGYPIHQFND